MSSFLDNDYDIPEKPGKYMKLKDGENRFRILSKSPLLGYVDWKDKKPIRFPMSAPPETSVDPARPFKHFWAMIVWNYTYGMVQILEITQTSIQKKLKDFVTDIDWGDPRHYDFKITRTGSGMDTEYAVKPGKESPIAPEILEHARATKIDIGELMAGADPFTAETEVAHTWWKGLIALAGEPAPRPRPAATEASEVLAGIEREENFSDGTNDLPF